LEQPLLARANYVNALQEPDIAPALRERARQQVRLLEERLFGASYVPTKDRPTMQPSPYDPPAVPEWPR
jgi:hypothetical protein